MFAELHCISNFSFLRGASHPEELVAQAHALGYQAIAITDECALTGVVRAHLVAQERAIQLIIGAEFALQDCPGTWVLLAPDQTAYAELCQVISLARMRAPKGHYRADTTLLMDASHCIALWRPALDHTPDETRLAQVCDRFRYFGLLAQWGLDGCDEQRYQVLQRWQARLRCPIVASCGAEMHVPERLYLHQTLAAIRHRRPLDAMGAHLAVNAARHLWPMDKLQQKFPSDWLNASLDVAAQCTFSLNSIRYQYPSEVLPQGKEANDYLAELTWQGARWRWPEGWDQKIQKRIEKELRIIRQLGFAHYFLTVYDIVRFARERNILCQGRGSAANSVVCFCLGITAVDPKKIDVLFERFVSEARNEPPDIDIDFEHERREEVIQYLYEKYGRRRAALTAVVIAYKWRSVVRDVGKAFGFSETEIKALQRTLSADMDDTQFAEYLKSVVSSERRQRLEKFWRCVRTILGFPRHLSQHVGGFVLSESPLDQLVPIEPASMPGRTVVQWDKDDLKAVGLMKVDILALGMLTAIRKCLQDIAAVRGQHWSLATIPSEDPSVYQMLQQGDSLGVFQVESRAQMAMLPRLKPKCFYDLVVQVAIVRPGPIQGDMVHPYLRRRQGLEPVDYISEDVRGVLEKTLGVPIFQEQVIRLAMVAAGFSAAEADQLRRSMAAWRRQGDLTHLRRRLIEGMLQRGYPQEFAERIFEQIKGFAAYGFPESHAASFALLVYASAWLKKYEPALFCCALLNSQPMGFYSPSQLIQDARRHGVTFLPVDVRYSHWDHRPECTPALAATDQPAIRLGLCLIKGLSKRTAQRICEIPQREKLTSVEQLAAQAKLSQAELTMLARAGALQGIVGDRHRAHWYAMVSHMHVEALAAPQAPAFLPITSEQQEVWQDYASTGLTLRSHPMRLLRQRHPDLARCTSAQTLSRLTDKSWVRVAGLVTCRQRPATASGTVFLTLEDETGLINLIVWPATAQAQKNAVKYARLLQVHGTITRADTCLYVVAGQLIDRTPWLENLIPSSRDFH